MRARKTNNKNSPKWNRSIYRCKYASECVYTHTNTSTPYCIKLIFFSIIKIPCLAFAVENRHRNPILKYEKLFTGSPNRSLLIPLSAYRNASSSFDVCAWVCVCEREREREREGDHRRPILIRSQSK
uniref:Uncharacterized protein n=1 Tax=Apteryx owenii TaxID=8824 RepID=A0A8B9QHJ2_APTOW